MDVNLSPIVSLPQERGSEDPLSDKYFIIFSYNINLFHLILQSRKHEKWKLRNDILFFDPSFFSDKNPVWFRLVPLMVYDKIHKNIEVLDYGDNMKHER